MTNPGSRRYRWRRIRGAGLLGLRHRGAAPAPARAPPRTTTRRSTPRFFRSILAGLGLRRDGDGIDYRERSPLVVPPSRNLPPPENRHVAEKTAAWPNDPTSSAPRRPRPRARSRARPSKRNRYPELPSQLERAAPRRRRAEPAPDRRARKDPTAPSTLAELGAKSIFTCGGLIGHKEEYATFTGEPPRTSLTEPPPGYRTPSPAQPYGVGKAKRGTPINPMDTDADAGQR